MDIEVTREQGGMREFEKTGIYPSYISFYIKQYKRNWRFKLQSDEQEGILKFKGNTIYQYEFAENTCKIIAVEKDKTVGDWCYFDQIVVMMID